MITLGINAAFHDSAAALVVDGIVVAAGEEERYTRIKHAKRPVPFSAWELPFHAIESCLAIAGATIDEVDHVAYSFDPDQFPNDPAHPSANPWDTHFLTLIRAAPGQLRDGVPHHLRQRLGSRRAEPSWQWHFTGHHLCHQASAFLAAPFERCAVLTLDGRGERASTTYGRYRDGRYESLGEIEVRHSLGLVYEAVTHHLGFLHSSDEYKVMALAAFGTPRMLPALQAAVRSQGLGRYEVGDLGLTALTGPRRGAGEPLQQAHFDLAASLQKLLETTSLEIATWLREASGESKLAMAGGVALNCVMNSLIRDQGPFEAVWVQPAAGDAGTALGAALWTDAVERGDGDGRLGSRVWSMSHAYLGPGYAEQEIEQQLSWAKLAYTRPEDLAEAVADELAAGAIVGWFEGRMEFGPRALGGRSILASPIDPRMQARINELKDREDFRPVAPAVPVEDLAEWFTPPKANGGTSPFMLFVYDVLPGCAERIPSACHSDGTARVQTVDPRTHPQFHALLKAFERRTGVPVLINTSFNVRGEPVVCSPQDAIESFFSTPLDVLAIGPFLVRKADTTR